MSTVAFDPTIDFLPLFPTMTEDRLLQDWMDWANEGLDPIEDADDWVDTREGGHWRTPITPALREFARVYDLLSEVAMAGFVLWAWGTYLDDLGATYDVQRKAGTQARGAVTFSGTDGELIDAGTRVAVEPLGPDDPAPEFEVTVAGTITGGSIDLPVIAVDIGAAGDVAAGAITAPSTPLPGVTFSNATPTFGGSDPETDDKLRFRILQALEGKGPGTVADIVRWGDAETGVGRTVGMPLWRGPGTALMLITDPDGQPLDSTTVDTVQSDIDPVSGTGAGTAPVGMALTVETSVPLSITVASSGIVFEDGYSADGAAGTIAVRPEMDAKLRDYLLHVQPGEQVVHSVVAGLVATTTGVKDAPTVTINGGTANITVALDPPGAAYLNTLTIA